MSRCYPYVPPGHVLSKEASLIESIKLQKQKEDKELRKKEKREKKEKRKEKKEKKKDKKEKTKAETKPNLDKSAGPKGDISKIIWTDPKEHFLQKTSESESVHLERSSVTEENGQPVCLRTSSSDSTENSNKRKRHSSSLDGGRSHGKILVRLPSKKLQDSNPSLKEQQLNLTVSVEKTQPSKKLQDINPSIKEQQLNSKKIQNKDEISLRGKPQNYTLPLEVDHNVGQSVPLKTDQLPLKTDQREICSTSGRTEDLPPIKISKVSKRMQKLASKYQDLIVNWVPPQLDDSVLYSEDLDWLCKGKNQDTRDVKRAKLENESTIMSCSASLTSWPRAQYLSEADIYALPYTVPF